MPFAIDFSSIADFYGWLWIIGSIIGAFYAYKASRRYRKKIIPPKKTKKNQRYTLLSDLPKTSY
jgi:beta-lactamase regulating signal transducer with metallopeptidase domain